MGTFKKILGPCFSALAVVSCAIETDPELSRDVDVFAGGVVALSAAVEQHYDATEKANKAALLDSLNLQFDLGGVPDIRLPKLFTAEERQARKTVLQALKTYGARLANAVAGDRSPPVREMERFAIHKLDTLRPEKMNISHALDRFQTRDLIASLSGFSKVLFFPKRDKELMHITKQAQPFVERLAFLLYLDLGASEDQSDVCRFSSPHINNFQNLMPLKLCRGGLRGLMATAIASTIVTWQQRLRLNSTKKPVDTARRTKIINRLLALQQAGQQQDAAMQGTQQALTDLVAAHHTLSAVLSTNSGPSEYRQDPTFLNHTGAINRFINSIAKLSGPASKAAGAVANKSVELRP